MFNLLIADCDCPRMLSSFPDREARPLKITVGEHPNGYCNQVETLLRLPENGASTLWAEMNCHDSTAVPLTRIPFVSALSEPNPLSREPCLNPECASRPALAFKTVAHGDTHGVALAYEPQLSAAARGLMVRHSSLPFAVGRDRTHIRAIVVQARRDVTIRSMKAEGG
jgi:hypothetical protein